MSTHLPAPGAAADGEAADGVRLRHAIRSSDEAVARVAWSRDGRLLAVPARDHRIRIYDGESGEERAELRGHGNLVLSASWSPDGTRLASGAYDNRIFVWDVATGVAQHRLEAHGREVNAVAWSPAGDLLASAAEDGQVLVWDVAGGFYERHAIETEGALHCAWSPDGRMLAVAGEEGRVQIWDAHTRARLETFEVADQPVVMVAWHPDGVRVAGAAKDGTIRVCKRGASGDVHTMVGHAGEVIAVAISADGAFVASKARDGMVLIWRCDTGRPVAFIPEETSASGWCVALAFHPARPMLVSSGEQGRLVRLWDLDAERLLAADVQVLTRTCMLARRRALRPTEVELQRVMLR